jgi:hypothetical protein
MNSSSHTPILTASEARHNIQKMFNSVSIDVSNASGYSESRWPGEYVAYYRFHVPSQDIEKVLNKYMFKKTNYRAPLKTGINGQKGKDSFQRKM